MSKANSMSLDEAILSSRYKAQFHTRDGTVLPPTMTSRRYRQATMSVVDMSLAMDMDCGLAMTRHQHCYDDHTSTRHRAKRVRRRRRHDVSDDVELMDTLDHTPRYLEHVTRDVTDTERLTRGPVIVHNSLNNERATRRPRLLTDNDYDTSQPKWTSSRYLQTHADKQRRRAGVKSRHNVNTRHHRHTRTEDLERRTSSPVCRRTQSALTICAS